MLFWLFSYTHFHDPSEGCISEENPQQLSSAGPLDLAFSLGESARSVWDRVFSQEEERVGFSLSLRKTGPLALISASVQGWKGSLGNDQSHKTFSLLAYYVSPSDKNQHLSFNLYIYIHNFEMVVGRRINEFFFKSNWVEPFLTNGIKILSGMWQNKGRKKTYKIATLWRGVRVKLALTGWRDSVRVCPSETHTVEPTQNKQTKVKDTLKSLRV